MSAEPTNLELTGVALREELMRYFKGTCVSKMVTQGNVYVREVPEARARYQYQRREQELRRASELRLGRARLAFLTNNPKEIMFRVDVMSRSPELLWLHGYLRTFLRDYLPAVNVAEVGTWKQGIEDDTKLVSEVQLADKDEELDMVQEYINYINLADAQTVRDHFSWTVASPNVYYGAETAEVPEEAPF